MPIRNIIFSLEQVNNWRDSLVYKGREGVNKIKQVQLRKEGVLILIIWGLIVPESEIQRVKEKESNKEKKRESKRTKKCLVLTHVLFCVIFKFLAPSSLPI